MNRLVFIFNALTAVIVAQDPAEVGRTAPLFDVVSVKPAPPDRPGRYESYCADGGRFISRGVPLSWAIKFAYGLNDYQLSDRGPAWLNSFGTYDIEAATESRVTENQCKLMVQSLFEDRFKLSMRRETKTVSAFGLVVAKNGPKLSAGGRVMINGAVKQSTSERKAPEGWTMPRLANYLASVKAIERPVLDRTSLSGTYGLDLNYSTRDNDDRPDVFAALPAQLGLRLEPIKAPITVFVIDHVEKPSGN